MSTLKNCHSPAGMGYSLHGTRLTKLRDCPRCKYGTIDRRSNDKNTRIWWTCADCGAEFSDDQIERIYGKRHTSHGSPKPLGNPASARE